MHVLVKHGVLRKVVAHRVGAPLLQVAADTCLHLLHVRQRIRQFGQRQIPAIVVRDIDRVIQLVHARQDRPLAQMLTQYPVLVEIGRVTDLPAQRIHDIQARPHHLPGIEPVDKTERPLPRVPDLCGQLIRHLARTPGNHGMMFARMAGKVTSALNKKDHDPVPTPRISCRPLIPLCTLH